MTSHTGTNTPKFAPSRWSENSRRLRQSWRRKSRSVPEGHADFRAAIFLAGKCPTLAGITSRAARKSEKSQEFSSSIEIFRKILSGKEFRTATAFSSFFEPGMTPLDLLQSGLCKFGWVVRSSFSLQCLDGQNRAIVIAESLVRVIVAIRIASVYWQSYLLPKKHRN